jgi:glycine C-acetyltransferase
VGAFRQHLQATLAAIESAGLAKRERVIAGAQGGRITLSGGREVINLCANNYLGLAGHPAIQRAAHAALDRWGYGLASSRFICGTQEIHRELEARLSGFLGTEETILYGSCFEANVGLFETLLGPEDAVIADERNHPSSAAGIRLCAGRSYRYRHCDLSDLADQLAEASAAGARFKLIVTDGVFSLDGTITPLGGVCDLAERFGAAVMIDDSHGTGILGGKGRGTAEHTGAAGRIDLISGTLGKALGGASGGFVSGRREMIDLLRQSSRPYLGSNTLVPAIVGGSLAVLDLLEASTELRDRLLNHAAFFRGELAAAGIGLRPGEHPIVPIPVAGAAQAQKWCARLLEKGVYAVGFFPPFVPPGSARIRAQVSAVHTRADLEEAVAAFAAVKGEFPA